LKTLIILFLIFFARLSFAQSSQFDTLAHYYEFTDTLPIHLCRAFAMTESSMNPNATREENTYFNMGDRYTQVVYNESVLFLKNHPAYRETLTIERAQRTISYGYFQIMGENLRRMGYSKQGIQPTINEQFFYFIKFITPIWRRYHDVVILANWYNSGHLSSKPTEYSKKILGYLK